jgi:hypothetical protein
MAAALQNQYDPRSNYAPSTTDFRHFFNGSFVYELPFGKGMRYGIRNGLLNSVAGGWEISSLFQIHSGMAFTPYVGTPNNSGSLAGSWRPNRLAKGTVANPTINEWFDPSAFEVPAANTFGNSGRNILYGPRWNNVNGALLKNFSIQRLGDKSKLQLKAEASNLAQSPQLRTAKRRYWNRQRSRHNFQLCCGPHHAVRSQPDVLAGFFTITFPWSPAAHH